MSLALLETDGLISGTEIVQDSYERDMLAASFVSATHVCCVHVVCSRTSWGRGIIRQGALTFRGWFAYAGGGVQAEVGLCLLSETIYVVANIIRGSEFTCSSLEDQSHSCGRLIQRGLGAGTSWLGLGRTCRGRPALRVRLVSHPSSTSTPRYTFNFTKPSRT